MPLMRLTERAQPVTTVVAMPQEVIDAIGGDAQVGANLVGSDILDPDAGGISRVEDPRDVGVCGARRGRRVWVTA